MAIDDREMKEAALIGFRATQLEIQMKIEGLQRELDGPSRRPAPARKRKPRAGNKMSPEARQRIVNGQKKRWAAYRKEKGE